MRKESARERRQPLFSFPSSTGVLGGVKDSWVCWDNRIELMRRRSWLKRLLRRQDEPTWEPAFYDQIQDVRVVPHLGTDRDDLIIVFKNGRPPFSLRAPRKNVEFVRSIILPRLNIR
jgi:hypothetical protein